VLPWRSDRSGEPRVTRPQRRAERRGPISGRDPGRTPGLFASGRAYDGLVPARNPTPEDRDEPVAIPLDPEEALRALLKVDPASLESEPVEDDDR